MKIRNIAPKQMHYKGGGRLPVFAINTKDRTIKYYKSCADASRDTGFTAGTVRDCIYANKQLTGSFDYVFMKKDELNIEVKENGELVFDEEEIKESIIKKLEIIKETKQRLEKNTIVGTNPVPVVLMDIETKKARRYPNKGEAATDLRFNKEYLRARVYVKGYLIVDDKKILIPLEKVINKEGKLDKTKYSHYLDILKQKGFKEATSTKETLHRYVNIDTMNENIDGFYLIDKNETVKKFKNLDSVSSFLDVDKDVIYNCVEQEKYRCSGFVLIPAYFFEKSTKEGNILDEKLLQKIVSITKDFATKEF